jgi:hypothetical protein
LNAGTVDIQGVDNMDEKEKRMGTLERMREVIDLFGTLPQGEQVTQKYIMDTLGIKSGSWVNIKDLLDTIAYVQAGPVIERKFFRKGTVTITRYKVRKENDTTKTEELLQE